MAEIQTFRSAFNGFNRQDVVSYIEMLNNRHNAERNQLNTQLQLLQEALDRARSNASNVQALSEALQDSDAGRYQAEQALEAMKQEQEALSRKLAQAEQAQAAVQAQSLLLEQTVADLQEQLAAIRERNAQQTQAALMANQKSEQERQEAVDRANRLYDTANTALTDATAQVDSASVQVSQLMAQIAGSLESLQSAVRESKQVLVQTAADLAAQEE